ncbi:hypothetical protein [Marinobacter sp.]|uniref:hypothetical protein n=1 Tax=Marinobacter sp. TaxID=50741 RepID=UPI003A8CB7FE
MDTSVLTPHLFDLSFFIMHTLLAITLYARCFNGDPEGLIVRVFSSRFCGRKSGELRGEAMSVLRYFNNEDVKLLHDVQGFFVSSRLILSA